MSVLLHQKNLANLKTEVDKIDIAKLTPASYDSAKLSNVVKNYVVKKTEYGKLVTKVDNIDTTGSVFKTKYDTDKANLQKKISDTEKKFPNTSNFAKKADLNAIITEKENKTRSISGLVTKSAITAVENKIKNVSNLVKKIGYNTNISETEKKLTDHNHDKYITTPEFNKFSAEVFDARFAQANFITKTDFNIKLQDISKITSNKSKHLLVEKN